MYGTQGLAGLLVTLDSNDVDALSVRHASSFPTAATELAGAWWQTSEADLHGICRAASWESTTSTMLLPEDQNRLHCLCNELYLDIWLHQPEAACAGDDQRAYASAALARQELSTTTIYFIRTPSSDRKMPSRW